MGITFIICRKGHTKEFEYISDYDWNLLKAQFMLFYAFFEKFLFKEYHTMRKN